jgi:hypothetical protein
MAKTVKSYYLRPINYRRAVSSKEWFMASFLCMKRKTNFNGLIDALLKEQFEKEKENEHVQSDSSK